MSDTPSSQESLAIHQAIAALRAGDFTTRLPDDGSAITRDINALAEQLGSLASEVNALSRSARQGRFGGQIEAPLTEGTWSAVVRDINDMSADQVAQFRGTALAITSIANGEFSTKAPTSAAGEVLELNTTINIMSDQYLLLRDEVRRAADHVRGRATSAQQIEVRGASGAWSELIDSITVLVSKAHS